MISRMLFWYAAYFDAKKQQRRHIRRLCCQLISALTFKCIAFCIAAAVGIVASYINGDSATFTVFVVGTVVGFAVNLDGLTSTAVFGTVHGTLALFPEASAGCFFRTFCTVTHDVDFPSGTKHIFVVSTGCCGTF